MMIMASMAMIVNTQHPARMLKVKEKTVHSCDDDDAAKGNFLKGLERNPAEMGRF